MSVSPFDGEKLERIDDQEESRSSASGSAISNGQTKSLQPVDEAQRQQAADQAPPSSKKRRIALLPAH